MNKAIELNPNFAEAYSKLGSEYANSSGDEILKTNRIKAAMQYHQYALKLQPKNADFLNNYGALLYQIGKKDEASDMYQKALRINYHHEKARENLNQLNQ